MNPPVGSIESFLGQMTKRGAGAGAGAEGGGGGGGAEEGRWWSACAGKECGLGCGRPNLIRTRSPRPDPPDVDLGGRGMRERTLLSSYYVKSTL